MTHARTRIASLVTRLAVTLAALAACVTAAAAQTVSVTDVTGGRGHGYMFRHGGACYVVLPRHVAEAFPQITVQTSAPVEIGSAVAITPFWHEMDLALAVARGAVEDRCVETIDRFDVPRRAAAATRFRLTRIAPNGQEEHLPLELEGRRGYLRMEARVTAPGQEVGTGTSGSLVFAGEAPVGMAYWGGSDGKRVGILRMEEIAMHVRRFLSEQGTSFALASDPTPVAQPAGVDATVASATAAPVSPDRGYENVLGEGLYVFALGRSAEIVLELEAATDLTGLRIEAPTDGATAVPKTVLVTTSEAAEGDRFRRWLRGEIALVDGVLDLGPYARRPARRVKVTVLDAWGDGPVAIERIQLR